MQHGWKLSGSTGMVFKIDAQPTLEYLLVWYGIHKRLLNTFKKNMIYSPNFDLYNHFLFICCTEFVAAPTPALCQNQSTASSQIIFSSNINIVAVLTDYLQTSYLLK